MTSTTAPAPPPTDDVVDEPGRALRPVLDAVCRVEAAVIDVLDTLKTMDHRRAAAQEGLAVETALRGLSGASGFDIAIFIETARVYDHVPALWDLHRSGALPWGLVRQVTVAARKLRTDQLARANSWFVDHGQLLAGYDVDLQQAHVNVMLDELTSLPTLHRREQADGAVDRFVLKPRLDGTSETYGSWSKESTALLTQALHHEADAPATDPCPAPTGVEVPDHPDDGGPDDGSYDADGGTARANQWRGQQLAQALLRLVTRGRGRDPLPTPPARLLVTVDIDTLTSHVAGTLQPVLPGARPTITARTLERLTCDAAIDAVVRDGTDLLAAQRYRPEVTAATRRAVTARDSGCRWPTCTAPIAWCDIHHVIPRAAGGDHATTNLVLLCRRHHTTVHRRGWKQALTAGGTYTLTRRGRTYQSLPRSRRLPPPPGHATPASRAPDSHPSWPQPTCTSHGPEPDHPRGAGRDRSWHEPDVSWTDLDPSRPDPSWYHPPPSDAPPPPNDAQPSGDSSPPPDDAPPPDVRS